MRTMVQRLIGTGAAVLVLLCGAGSAEAQAHAATAISIVVAPTDRIVFTGAPAAVEDEIIEAAAAGSTILRTASTASDAGLGATTAQDVCATRPNDDPAWLVRSSQLSVTRAATVNAASREPVLTCTLVAP